MRGPHGPRKTLKAAQTVIIVYDTEALSQQALILPHLSTLILETLDSVDKAPGSARTPLHMDTQSVPHGRELHQGV